MLGRTLVVAAGFGFPLMLAGAARADDEPNVVVEPAAPDPKAFKRGVEFGFHLGPSFVVGNADKGQPLHEQVGAPLALGGEVGYRFSERV